MSQETLDLLEKQLGQPKHGPWLLVDQERIQKFAEATGDFQWIHIDPERAKKESPYKTTIAHGFLTLSLLPMLTREGPTDTPAFPGVKLMVNYGSNRVRYPAPVLVGSRLRAQVTLKEIQPIEGGVQLLREVIMECEGSEKPCMAAEVVLRLYWE